MYCCHQEESKTIWTQNTRAQVLQAQSLLVAWALPSQVLHQLPGSLGKVPGSRWVLGEQAHPMWGHFASLFVWSTAGVVNTPRWMNAYCQCCRLSRHGQQPCLQEHSEWLLWARHPGAGDPAGRKPAKEFNKVIVYLVTGGAGCSHWGEGRAGRASWEMGSPCQVLKNVEELDRWKGLAGKFRGLGVVG